MITAKAPGKLLLLGEYAVLEGAPALVMAVDRRVKVSVEDYNEGTWVYSSLPSWEHPLRFDFTKSGRFTLPGSVSGKGLRRLAPVRWALQTAMQRGCYPLTGGRGMKIIIDTRDFSAGSSDVKLGLGSSAALTVALLAALRRVQSPGSCLPLGRESLFREALASHSKAQRGLGSGVDVAASVYGGVLRYERGTGRVRRPLIAQVPGFPPAMRPVVIWTGKPASTARLLAILRDFKRRRDRAYRGAIAALARTSVEGCDAFIRGDAQHFMECVEGAYRGLEVLGKKSGIDIVSPAHRAAKRIVHTQGGVYKPSGAGVGDLGIAFFPETEARERALAVLRERGYGVVDLDVDRSGIVTGEKLKNEN